MRSSFSASLIILLSLLIILPSCTQDPLNPEEARAIAKEAYIYGFPMVMNYKTMYLYAVNENSPEYKGGFNHLTCMARVFTPQDKAIVTPNSDTPYCFYWGDMRAEPLVLTIPEIEANRYYQVQLVDLFTHNFAYVSTVATGNVPGSYLITGPDWKGGKPAGIKEVIPCETQFLFAVIRTQLFNPDDLENVKRIQAGYRFEPLSVFSGTESPKTAGKLDFPAWNEGEQFNAQAFKFLDFMLDLVQTPPEEDKLMARLAKLNLGTQGKFDLNAFTANVQDSIHKGVKEGNAELKSFIKSLSTDPLGSTKIFGTRRFLQKSAETNFQMENFFMLRSAAAHAGLYGNSGKEAIYPTYFADADGDRLDAAKNQYELIFAKGDLPPVSAFWSITMYDAKTQLLVENPLNRYLINSTMIDQFKKNKDGSLTLYIQKNSPGKKLESNWLPAPDGPFYCTLRLYGPQQSALSGKWTNPPMVKSN